MVEVLVVDDEPAVRRVICDTLISAGYRVHAAASGEEALELGQRTRTPLAVIDLKLPGMDGLETFARLRHDTPGLMAVILTGFASYSSCVQAIKKGAFHYLSKPFTGEQLVAVVRDASASMPARTGSSSAVEPIDGMIGGCAAMREVYRRIDLAAASHLPVLINGETGTGKELVAKAIHRRSPRASEPFVDVNCGAIPATLFESEFFGHERGAFTDARDAAPGKFEQAHGGTLFLDEVGELPRDIQVKFLRALATGDTTRVGGRVARRSDVRIVAATNADLTAAVARQDFRADLHFRLNVLPIRVPPLRERGDDIDAIIDCWVTEWRRTSSMSQRSLSREFRNALRRHTWPGNVRELRNVLQAAWTLAATDIIVPEDLPVEMLTSERESTALPTTRSSGMHEEGLLAGIERIVGDYERARIGEALRTHHGNRTAAAASLGVDRRTLHDKLRRHRIR